MTCIDWYPNPLVQNPSQLDHVVGWYALVAGISFLPMTSDDPFGFLHCDSHL